MWTSILIMELISIQIDVLMIFYHDKSSLKLAAILA